MIQVFGHSLRKSVLLMGMLEAFAVYASIFMLATLVVHSPDGPSGLTSAAVLPAVLIFLFMLAFGVYEPDARANLATMTERLAVACLMGAGLGFGLIYIFGSIWVSPLYAAACASFSYGVVTLARLLISRVMRAEAFQRRILVLGEAEGVARARAVAASKGADAHIVAALTKRAAMAGDVLATKVKEANATEIVVADRGGPLPGAALFDCKAQGVIISDMLDFGERETGKVDLENLYPARFIFSRNTGFDRWAAWAKRFMDLFVSGVALVLLAPVLLITAVAIRLDSPGSIFYTQTRTGLNGAPYEIVKFRSMRSNAEAAGSPQWAQANDSRVTRVGRFLRQTRIDELPQLWNILKGEMSLVGPRPERPYFVEQLARSMPYYHERHRVKPGLTGWAQINYRYGATEDDAREKLRYDLYYVKNFNLFLDIAIMFKTLRVVLWPDGVH